MPQFGTQSLLFFFGQQLFRLNHEMFDKRIIELMD